ncbi:MAG: DUF565 domain-containing protein [Oscillatoriaceae cyanobacterium]
MQNTRLNTIVDTLFNRLEQWLRNPWRRTSLLALSLLFGFFLGEFVASVAGQKANLDVTMAATVLVVTEGYSWFLYRAKRELGQLLLPQSLNCLKLGFMYSMYLEAFKLAS